MIIIDANLLLYAYHEAAVQHVRARDWLQSTLNGSETVGLPWAVVLSFLRISTDLRIMDPPMPSDVALAIVDELLARSTVLLLRPETSHWHALSSAIREGRCRGRLIPDAHLAALAIERGALLCSSDHDFARFRGLRWLDPLEETR